MAISVRFLNDTGIQIFGPFLSTIAAGLGVSIVSLGALNSLRSLMGLMAPLVGSLADAIGYRATMRTLLLLSATGCLIFALSPALWLTVIGLAFMGLGGLSLPPVLQAYFSAQIPYERRSRAIGMLEYGWALAGIIGLSASGLLIDRFSWRAPFIVMSAGLFVAFFVFRTLPATTGSHSRSEARHVALQWREWPRRVRDLLHLEENARSAWAAILVNGLNVFGATTVSIVYGVWLAREYNFSTTSLGLVALSLGLAELSGSVLVSLIGDRVGKYRSILTSALMAIAAYGLLPFLNFSVPTVIAGLILTRFIFEINIVSSISLISEQVPTQRGKALTLGTAIVTTGVAGASLVGPIAYSQLGIWGPALIASGSAALSSLLMVRWVKERRAPALSQTGLEG